MMRSWLWLCLLIGFWSWCYGDGSDEKVDNYRRRLLQLKQEMHKLQLRQQLLAQGSQPQKVLQRELCKLANLKKQYQELYQQQKLELEQRQIAALRQIFAPKPKKATTAAVVVADIPKRYLALADLYWQQRQYSHAAAAYRKALAQSADNVFLAYKTACAEECDYQWPQAVALYRQVAATGTPLLQQQTQWNLRYLQWKKKILSRLDWQRPEAPRAKAPGGKPSAPAPRPRPVVKPLQPTPIKLTPALVRSYPARKKIAKAPERKKLASNSWQKRLSAAISQARRLLMAPQAITDTQTALLRTRVETHLDRLENYPLEAQTLAKSLQCRETAPFPPAVAALFDGKNLQLPLTGELDELERQLQRIAGNKQPQLSLRQDLAAVLQRLQRIQRRYRQACDTLHRFSTGLPLRRLQNGSN